MKVTANIFTGTAEDLPSEITDRQYAVVLMSHVLEHCLDVDAAMSNAKHLLKPGGIFVVETPNNACFGFKQQGGAWPWADIPRHLNFFTPDSLRQAVERHGFTVERVKYRGYLRQFSVAWLENEEKVCSAFAKYGERRRPRFRARAWLSLLTTAFADDATKYDSVRLLARNA